MSSFCSTISKVSRSAQFLQSHPYLLHNKRREPEKGSSRSSSRGLLIRASDREHLLLAARKRVPAGCAARSASLGKSP